MKEIIWINTIILFTFILLWAVFKVGDYSCQQFIAMMNILLLEVFVNEPGTVQVALASGLYGYDGQVHFNVKRLRDNDYGYRTFYEILGYEKMYDEFVEFYANSDSSIHYMFYYYDLNPNRNPLE